MNAPSFGIPKPFDPIIKHGSETLGAGVSFDYIGPAGTLTVQLDIVKLPDGTYIGVSRTNINVPECRTWTHFISSVSYVITATGIIGYNIGGVVNIVKDGASLAGSGPATAVWYIVT